MKIIHLVKLASNSSSGFNKQIPILTSISADCSICNTNNLTNSYQGHISGIHTIKQILFQEGLILHAHSILNIRSLFILKLAQLKGHITVYSPRGELRHSAILSNSAIKKLIYFRSIKSILKKCHLHFLSEVELNEYLFFGLSFKSFVVIPNAIKEQNIKFKKNKNNEFEILYVGRLLFQLKNLQLLIESIPDIEEICLRKNKKLKVSLVGHFNNAKEKEIIYSAIKKVDKENTCVRIIEGVDNNKVPELMSNANLLYNLSFSEGFPNVILEALMCNLHIITSHNTGIQHYFTNSNLVTFTSISKSEFLIKIKQLIVNETQISHKKKQHQEFSIEILRSTYLQFYRSLKR